MPDTATPDTAAPVLVHHADGVRTITLNRPQALNSLDAALHAGLMRALDDAAADGDVRCVVLTGAGRAFCAGQDLADPAVSPDSAAIDTLIDERYRPLALRLHGFPTPVVAAVNGVAAGAGANLALNCDIVVAARSASFIQAFSKIGLIPDCGGSWLLPRLVGRGRAMGLAMLADKLPAEDALGMGLIWQVVDDADLASAARAVAMRLAGLPTGALVKTREAFDAAGRMPLDEALALEGRLQGDLGRSADYREGVRAFFERRAPRFSPR